MSKDALPEQVRKQIAQADAIIDQLHPELREEDEAPAEEQAAPPAAPQKEAPPPETDAEHRYKVLQGKYNKEVPRLQSEIRQFHDENAQLRQRLNDLQATIESMRTVSKEPPAPLVSDEEREQFGDDLIDLISRVSKRDVLPELEKRLKDVDSHVKQVDEKVAQNAESMAESKRRETLEALAAAVPNWEQQNEDPNFLAWLGENEPSVGVPRGRLLTDAFQSDDAQRVIWFFKGFQSENAAAATDATPVQQQQPEPQQKLDDYVAPGSPKTGTASAPDESGKRVWTREDIAAYYRERQEFVKRGKKVPERLLKLERDIFRAQQEGRVT